MPTSDQSRLRSDSAVTAGLTAFVALILLALAWLVPLQTTNAGGEHREMSGIDIWREMLADIPSDAPFFLTTATMTILSILALIISAWIIVAIARLPD